MQDSIDPSRILTADEVRTCLKWLHHKCKQSFGRMYNVSDLAIFRLSTCCGLRVSELIAVQLRDIKTLESTARPFIQVRPETSKGKKGRKVRLWWDAGTLQDLTSIKHMRRDDGAASTDTLVVARHGGMLTRYNARRRWMRAVERGLTEMYGRDGARDRMLDLTIHSGRHTAASQYLQSGRTLTEVRDQLGHSSIAITNTYLHVAADDGQVKAIW